MHAQLHERAFRQYEQARVRGTWNPRTDLDWSQQSLLSTSRQELGWQIASQSVYAEQAGLLYATRLLQATDDLPTRLALATAVSDEAKHAEVFARYALLMGDSVEPPLAPVLNLWTGLDEIDDPAAAFLVHMFLEGFATDEFSIFVQAFAGDLLGTIYSLVRRDESRHVGIGIEYLTRRMGEFDDDEAMGLVDSYSAHAISISGLFATGAVEFLATLSGRSPDELVAWLQMRHRKRIDLVLGKGGDRRDKAHANS